MGADPGPGGSMGRGAARGPERRTRERTPAAERTGRNFQNTINILVLAWLRPCLTGHRTRPEFGCMIDRMAGAAAGHVLRTRAAGRRTTNERPDTTRDRSEQPTACLRRFTKVGWPAGACSRA
eukprot:1586091-Prymnesium_polylepis.1